MGIQTSSINNGPTSGFKNAIINGNFDFWQRGTSVNVNAGYAADRWRLDLVGSSCTLSQQTFTVGQTQVPGNPTFWMRSVVASVAGAANYANVIQAIEDVRTFSGQQVTISYWAKADSSKPIAVSFGQYFGTSGSPSASVTLFVAKPTLTTSWARYSHTITLPSISGKTIGSDQNGSALVIAFNFDAGSNFNSSTGSLGQQSGTFDIAQVQLERGPIATDFEQRPIGTELALCQRYYQFFTELACNPAVSSGSAMVQSFPLMNQMRAAPGVIYTNKYGSVNFIFADTNGITLNDGARDGAARWGAENVALSAEY